MSDVATYRDLAEAAWSWTLDQVRDDDGPWPPQAVDEEEPRSAEAWERDCLYVGIAGNARDQDEVARTVAENLVSDVDRPALGVPRLQLCHAALRSPDAGKLRARR